MPPPGLLLRCPPAVFWGIGGGAFLPDHTLESFWRSLDYLSNLLSIQFFLKKALPCGTLAEAVSRHELSREAASEVQHSLKVMASSQLPCTDGMSQMSLDEIGLVSPINPHKHLLCSARANGHLVIYIGRTKRKKFSPDRPQSECYGQVIFGVSSAPE